MWNKVNGFCLLLSFGLVVGVISGAISGVGMAFYITKFPSATDLIVFSGIGVLCGLIPGMLLGLTSYYFSKVFDWLITGGLCGSIPGIVIFFGFGLEWRLLLVSACYGVLIGFINMRLPHWWGMRLRTEAIELLRPNS